MQGIEAFKRSLIRELDEKQAREVTRMVKPGDPSATSVARLFQVHPATLCRLIPRAGAVIVRSDGNRCLWKRRGFVKAEAWQGTDTLGHGGVACLHVRTLLP